MAEKRILKYMKRKYKLIVFDDVIEIIELQYNYLTIY